MHRPVQDQQGPQKRYVYLAFFVLMACAVAVTVFVCVQVLATAKQELVAQQASMIGKDVRDTVAAAESWREELKTQASRLSASETYRLFAKEADMLDEQSVGRLNDAENLANDGSDLANLAMQVPFMRNVLLDFINYAGFTDARIINESGQTLLSAQARPVAVTPDQLVTIRQALSQNKLLMAPVRASSSSLMLDMADPLQAMFSGEGTDAPVAALLLTLPVSGQIGRFLSSENRLKPDATIQILQRKGDIWENIRVQDVTPLPAALQKELRLNLEGHIPFALRSSLNGKQEVYSLALPVTGLDWWVMAELPASLVNDALREKATLIYGVGALACTGFILLLPLLWWLAVGRAQHATALRFRELYHTIQQQKQLLDSVNDSLEVGLFMANEQGEIQLCNPAFATIVREDEEHVQGKGLFLLFKDAGSEKFLAGVTTVLREAKATTFEVEVKHGAESFLYRTTLFPFMDTQTETVTGVVGTMQDITEFRRRNLQQQRQQLQTMSAFMRAIESVDPYLAGHSQMMKALGLLVAKELHLDDRDLRTISAAAELSQVGKLSLPQSILKKEGKLTEEEQAEIQRVPHYAHSILRDISFELPVAEAVYAMCERMDGQGYPRSLKGEEICIHARVLAVLNVFCAMTSPRSYREGMPVDKALEILRNSPAYDQAVVEALQQALFSAEGSNIVRHRKVGENLAG